MDTTDRIGYSLNNAYNNTVEQIGNFLPNIISAFVLFIIGMIIANVAGALVKRLLEAFQINKVFEEIGVTRTLKDANIQFKASDFAGQIVRWFLIIVFLIAVADALQLSQISEFINQVAAYVPNVIAASFILIIGVTLTNFVGGLIAHATKIANIASPTMISTIVRWAIIVFSTLAALVQLNIASTMIQILFTGIVAALSIALGLAFGLGGRDEAKQILEEMRRRSRDVRKVR